MNCYLLCMIASALFGSMLYLSLNMEKDKVYQQYLQLLDDEQKQVLKEINQERLTIYIKGLALGLVLGFIFLQLTKKGMGRTCGFIIIVMAVNYLFYLVYPKSKYMITHLKTQEQKQGWLKVYKTMQFNHYFGMVLGAVAYAIVSVLPN